jgi:FdhE protein
MHNRDSRRERVRVIVNKRPAYAELLNFLIKIIEAREKAALELAPCLPDPVDRNFRKKMERGLPVLDRKSLPLDSKALHRFLESMLDILEERNPDEIKKIRTALADGRVRADSLVRNVLLGSDIQEADRQKDALDAGLLTFLGQHAASAVLGVYAKRYASTLASIHWKHGYCPLCGGVPHMAELRGPEGRRFLACGTCGYCWNFPRIACPFCGNIDQERLGYFQAEKEKEYRVDYCRECKKYIKTVDLREPDMPLDLEIESAATLHLDLLVQAKGYVPPMPQSLRP